MATVGRELAEKQVAHCKQLKKPRMYCIAKYWNTMFRKECFSLCYTRVDYQALVGSPAVGAVNILWASQQFQIDREAEDILD